MILRRSFLMLACLGLLAACESNDLKEPPVPLGDFFLGLNIAVTDNVQKVPISREATPAEWKEVMEGAMSDRFGRYTGNRMYDFGVSVDAYALAPPGIPVVAAPKSVLVITVHVWDDQTQTKLNPKGKQITVLESLSPDSVIGTGLTRTKKHQMKALAYNATYKVQQWLLKNPQWFTDNPTVGDMTENEPDLLSAMLPDSERAPAAAAPALPIPAGPAAPAAPATVETTPLAPAANP